MSAALPIDWARCDCDADRPVLRRTYNTMTKVVATLKSFGRKIETSKRGACFHRGTFEKATVKASSIDFTHPQQCCDVIP